MRVLVLGATGTIGRATVPALVARGHEVVALVRSNHVALPGATCRIGDATMPRAVAVVLRDFAVDAIVSCVASRSGAPADAWAIDHDAHVSALAAAQAAGVKHFVLLSALCVQKPRLAFQHAKRAFEIKLIASGLRWSIVRPTAFFKSLSGQVARVQAGKPFLLFSDGRLTATKPIGDADLGGFIADCLTDPARWDRILPIGGPGPARTPRDDGEALFALLGQPPRFREVPVGLLDAIIAVLSVIGRFVPALAAKAELARIGRYYATEAMLVIDPASGHPDADLTPETGTATLIAHHAALLAGTSIDDRGDHAVF